MPDGLTLSHQFVEFMPPQLEEHTVYISTTYKTAIHLCCCGCGGKVVTRLSPRHWKLIFDGETISLVPSIGNWSFQCRSHYWVERSRVKWDGDWTDEEVAAEQENEEREEERYLAGSQKLPEQAEPESALSHPADKCGLWQRFKQWLTARWH